MNNEQLKSEPDAPVNDGPEWDVETVIERVWHDLKGKINRSVILQVLLEIMPKYESARVTVFIPILVHRQAMATLRPRLAEVSRVNPVRVYRAGAKPNNRIVRF